MSQELFKPKCTAFGRLGRAGLLVCGLLCAALGASAKGFVADIAHSDLYIFGLVFLPIAILMALYLFTRESHEDEDD